MDTGRVVDQRSAALFTGHAGLYDGGFFGQGQTVGLVDYPVTAPELEPYVAYRSTRLPAPGKRAQSDHGNEMATAIVDAAPQCLLAAVNVMDRDGQLLRSAIADGINELRELRTIRIINLSLWRIRTPLVCTLDNPCVACSAAEAAGDDDLIVVAAAGNLGDRGVTCPGAARGIVSVGATEGPAAAPATTDQSIP